MTGGAADAAEYDHITSATWVFVPLPSNLLAFDTNPPLALEFQEHERGEKVFMCGRWEIQREVEKTGIKPFDALHIACAITVHCDYLITVDRRMAKYRDDRIVICNPVDFINREAGNDE